MTIKSRKTFSAFPENDAKTSTRTSSNPVLNYFFSKTETFCKILLNGNSRKYIRPKIHTYTHNELATHGQFFIELIAGQKTKKASNIALWIHMHDAIECRNNCSNKSSRLCFYSHLIGWTCFPCLTNDKVESKLKASWKASSVSLNWSRTSRKHLAIFLF